MELTFACPHCQAVNRLKPIELSPSVNCAACQEQRLVHATSFEEGSLVACPLCATEDMYIQKDFPQNLGITIVVIGFIVSSVFWYYERPLVTYAILLASALLDLFLYYRVPNVTICYRCLSQVRGEGSNTNERFKAFDLGTGERYRQERIRIQEIRERSQSPEKTGPSSRP